jgi:hypothetical protein
LTDFRTYIIFDYKIAEERVSERFEKTYISVSEFVSSWEKEIYELNNLDYFTFLLINYLGFKIEHSFFNSEEKSPYLRIDPEEIATLSFNIGDCFESFLENNCFGDCNLSCPTKLDDKVDPNQTELEKTHLNIIHIMNGKDQSKKQLLLTDILNYVVLDTLFDFYNYEIGLDLDDADIGLMQFADFITVILEKFIESRGQALLVSPKEPASDLFENIIAESENDWDELPPATFEDTEEKEDWKYGNLSVANVVQDYLIQSKNLDSISERVLEYFQSYTDEYAGILQIDDFSKEDFEEFFLFWLLREISLEKEISSEHVRKTFENFFIWLELSRGLDLKNLYEEFFTSSFDSFDKTLTTIRLYFENNSVINGILEANSPDDQIIDGFFQVEKVNRSGLLRLSDIHFRQTYLNVKINLSDALQLDNTILYASLKHTAYGWRIINLEYIFPAKARPYLH